MRVFKSLPYKRTVLLSVAVIGVLLVAAAAGDATVIAVAAAG